MDLMRYFQYIASRLSSFKNVILVNLPVKNRLNVKKQARYFRLVQHFLCKENALQKFHVTISVYNIIFRINVA